MQCGKHATLGSRNLDRTALQKSKKSDEELTWQINWKVPIFNEEMKILDGSELCCRHWPKQCCSDISSVSDTNCPTQERVDHYHGRGWLELIQELLKWAFHFGHDGFKEGIHVVTTALLRWNNIGDCCKADVVHLCFRANEAEPLFCDDKGDKDITLHWS